ncbi:MAG: HAD-IA family hydrolase [Betaproteobacteria bacterium]|nr:HAD-IA family hydrolase [Betaproteobacteria bacterium]
MGKNFDLLVFDWDGTIFDSAAAIVAAVQAACRDLGLPEVPTEQARHVIGMGLDDAMRYVAPGLPSERYREMAARYRHHYLASDHQLELFAGIEAMIVELASAGFPLAVATGKSRIGLERAFAISGLKPYFRASRCADECFSKPHPQMLESLMEEFDVPSSRTLMIGDTTHDLQMAKNANVASVGVSYGAHPRASLDALMPLECFDSVADLHGWLLANA